MKKYLNTHIAEEVDKTIALLEDRVEIDTGSWFYTRLHAKMSEKQRYGNDRGNVLMKPALLLLFVLVNIVTLLYVFDYSAGVSAQQQIADEYYLTLNSSELLDLNLEQGE